MREGVGERALLYNTITTAAVTAASIIVASVNVAAAATPLLRENTDWLERRRSPSPPPPPRSGCERDRDRCGTSGAGVCVCVWCAREERHAGLGVVPVPWNGGEGVKRCREYTSYYRRR